MGQHGRVWHRAPLHCSLLQLLAHAKICEVRCPAAAGPARRSSRGTLCSAPGVGLQPEQWGMFRAQLPPTPWGKKFCRSSYGTGAHLAQWGHPKRGWCGPVLVRTHGSIAWEHLRDETAPQARHCSPGMSWDVQSCTSCQMMAAGVATGCPKAPVPPSLQLRHVLFLPTPRDSAIPVPGQAHRCHPALLITSIMKPARQGKAAVP